MILFSNLVLSATAGGLSDFFRRELSAISPLFFLIKIHGKGLQHKTKQHLPLPMWFECQKSKEFLEKFIVCSEFSLHLIQFISVAFRVLVDSSIQISAEMT